jgi:hypothetical protein
VRGGGRSARAAGNVDEDELQLVHDGGQDAERPVAVVDCEGEGVERSDEQESVEHGDVAKHINAPVLLGLRKVMPILDREVIKQS